MRDESPKVPPAPATVPSQVTSLGSPESVSTPSVTELQREVDQLTAEEQLARFEKELKEHDWGHQPC